MVVGEDIIEMLISTLLFGLLHFIDSRVSKAIPFHHVVLSHFKLPNEVHCGQDRIASSSARCIPNCTSFPMYLRGVEMRQNVRGM